MDKYVIAVRILEKPSVPRLKLPSWSPLLNSVEHRDRRRPMSRSPLNPSYDVKVAYHYNSPLVKNTGEHNEALSLSDENLSHTYSAKAMTAEAWMGMSQWIWCYDVQIRNARTRLLRIDDIKDAMEENDDMP